MTTRSLILASLLAASTTAASSAHAAATAATPAVTAQATPATRKLTRREKARIVQAGGVVVRPRRQAAWKNNQVMGLTFAAWNHQAGPKQNGENTLAGFESGLEQGLLPDTDLRATADGRLPMHHDPETGRHTRGPRLKIAATDWATLKRDVKTIAPDGSVHELATFDELIDRFPDTPISVEVKSMDAARALVTLIKANPKLLRQGIYHAFSDKAIKYMRAELGPDLVTSLATIETVKLYAWSKVPLLPRIIPYDAPGDVVALPVTLGEVAGLKKIPVLRNVRPNTPKMVKLAHRNGIKVYDWTSNDGAEMRRLLANGSDGIYSNSPDTLAEAQHDMTHSGAP